MRNLILVTLFLIAPAFSALAACHAVGPSATGGGTGADWNNIATQPGTPTIANAFSTFTVQASNTAVWDSGIADSIMTTVQPVAPNWTITGDSGLSCTLALFRAHQ